MKTQILFLMLSAILLGGNPLFAMEGFPQEKEKQRSTPSTPNPKPLFSDPEVFYKVKVKQLRKMLEGNKVFGQTFDDARLFQIEGNSITYTIQLVFSDKKNVENLEYLQLLNPEATLNFMISPQALPDREQWRAEIMLTKLKEAGSFTDLSSEAYEKYSHDIRFKKPKDYAGLHVFIIKRPRLNKIIDEKF